MISHAKKQKDNERNRINAAYDDRGSIIFNQFLRNHKKVVNK